MNRALSMRPLCTLLVLLTTATACNSGVQKETSALPHSWITTLAEAPNTFNTTIEAERSAWIALHSNDPHKALAESDTKAPLSTTRVRSLVDLTVLFDDLAFLSGQIQSGTFRETTLVDEPDHRTQAAIAAAECHGFTDLISNAKSTEDIILTTRLKAHQALIDGTLAPQEHLALGESPLLYSESKRGYDPCLFAAQRDFWNAQLLLETNTDGWREALSIIKSPLFSVWTTTNIPPEDLSKADTLAAVGAFTSALTSQGLAEKQRVPETNTDARQEIRSLTKSIDLEKALLLERADKTGQALVAELSLFQGLRQKILLSRARSALKANQFQAALTYASEAIDIGAKNVGPLNSANAFVVLTAARITNGRTREAMDALQPILRSHPYIHGLYEQLGDLVVRENINRTGESKEN